jgi:hypothetical protein
VSDGSDPYDPSAPEGEVSSRGQYMTRRDMRTILISLAVLAIGSVPVYRFLLAQTESSRCTRNMQGISEALTLYTTEHDGKLPPIDETETLDGLAPSVSPDGKVYTWASDVSVYMNARSTFLCPSAKPSELVATEDPRGTTHDFLSSYGMYSAYGTVLNSLIENPDQTIIIAETSNEGSLKTYDPDPLKSQTGKILPDGFVIGWNGGNLEPTKDTRFVTRLAFPNTNSGIFVKDGDARHGNTIHEFTASGQLIDAQQTGARFGTTRHTNPEWALPPISRDSH